jgi:peptidoglycan/xylan/chitin deacetylase (PgdA/CDA1 family)
MDRRTMLGLLAASVAGAVSACTSTPGNQRGLGPPSGAAGTTPAPGSTAGVTGTRGAAVFGQPTGIVKCPVPKGTLAVLPGSGKELALTVDDGTDSGVVAAYAKLCQETGLRLTFFCNGVNRSWTENAPVLRPLVDAGQVFMANHTWSHPDLTKLTSQRITEEVRRNETFLMSTYGVNGRPFLRPPYGARSSAVDGQLADLGYPAVTMWLGSLGDSTVESPDSIVQMAQQWFLPQHLVIGHANHPPVTQVMDRLIDLIQSRGLTPVHLGDVFDAASTPPSH